MISNFISWYNDTGSRVKLCATSSNWNPNMIPDKSCLCSITEYILLIIEEDTGQYFSYCFCLGCVGAKLFLCIPEIATLFGTKVYCV